MSIIFGALQDTMFVATGVAVQNKFVKLENGGEEIAKQIGIVSTTPKAK